MVGILSVHISECSTIHSRIKVYTNLMSTGRRQELTVKAVDQLLYPFAGVCIDKENPV